MEYVRALSTETGIRNQVLINLYLHNRAVRLRKLSMTWDPGSEASRPGERGTVHTVCAGSVPVRSAQPLRTLSRAGETSEVPS